MPVTIGFQGLCAIVSETPSIETSRSLDVLLVDAIEAGLECEHDAVMTLPATGLDDPDNLTVPDPDDGTRRRMPLAGRRLRFLPGGQFPVRGGYQTANLNLIPEMRRVCGIGTVDSGCFEMPPTRPITARIELPMGGTLSGNDRNKAPGEWSFAPPVSTCYHGTFTWEAQFELPAANPVVIEVQTLDGQSAGSLTLRTDDGRLAITNLCPEASDAESDDTLVYYELLNPPFSNGIPPRARNNAVCHMPNGNAPGIGCIPFLLSRA